MAECCRCHRRLGVLPKIDEIIWAEFDEQPLMGVFLPFALGQCRFVALLLHPALQFRVSFEFVWSYGIRALGAHIIFC